MKHQAYWISPEGKIIPVTERHINVIIQAPEKFGLTKELVQKIYKKFREPYGFEGNAREKIMLELIKNHNWTRLRFIPKYSTWTVELNKLDKKAKNNLWGFFTLLTGHSLGKIKPIDKVKPFHDIKINELRGDENNVSSSQISVKDLLKFEGEASANIEYMLIENYVPTKKTNAAERLQKMLDESSLSKLWRHNVDHDCGGITAFRRYKDCREKKEKYTKAEKMAMNKSLKMKLLSKGYTVIQMEGKYLEGNEPVTEISYFVVDIKDMGNLKKDLISLGTEFQQDSILFAPQGAVVNKAKAFLYGTNNCPDAIGQGETISFDVAKFGKSGQFYTSFINNRPFVFEGYHLICGPNTGYGNWGINVLAEKHWTKLIE